LGAKYLLWMIDRIRTADDNLGEFTLYLEEVVVEKSPKSFVAALLLCFFLGSLSGHRFYAGKVGTAILQIVTLGGLGIWLLIDLILIIVGKFTDSEGRLITAS